jgi:toxin secretion/phage lysis holin
MEKLLNVKNSLCLAIGTIGGVAASALGGADKLLRALVICVVADYLTGLIVAVIFKNSPKTETGAAESNAGFKGLVKKAFIFTILLVINQVDIVLGSGGFLRNATIIGFITNECISLIENAGLMGLKLPPAVTNAIDILKKKSEEKKENQGA